jgi:hypothetical protein
VPAGVTSIDLFAVGGGGAGGSHGGSGGGGGAAISRTALPVTASTNLTVKIGYGGSGSFTDGWSGGAGDSTTITFPSGLLMSANGGAMGVKGDGTNLKTGGLGGTAVNGGFAGGAGGASSTTLNSRGLVGKTGISNYFLGTLAQFGGGGGGGTHKNACTPLDGQLGASGGAAGASCNSNVNSVGGSALAETGGGGGGGGYGTSGNTLGGRGGSGVVYLRYAINAADAFPVSVASALAGRWLPSDLQMLDSTRKAWIDSSGTYASVTVTGTPSVTTQGTTDSGFTTGSSKSNLTVTGATGDAVTLVGGTLTNYTLFHVARYIRGTTLGRLVTASAGNFISGHYNAENDGVAHHNNAWLTPTARATEYKWLLSTDMAKVYRANGEELAYRFDQGGTAGATGPTFLGINNYSSELTAWQMTEVLLFNRQLTTGEVRLVENYMARIYGLTLDPDGVSAETDTAASFTAGEHFFVNYGIGNTLNDTFTIQAWIRTTDACASICQIVVKEGTVLLGVHNGTLRYMLTGKTVAGDAGWFDTGVKVPAQEWHHVAMVKQFTGDKNGSILFYLDGKLAYTVAGTPYQVGTNYNSTSSSYAVADIDNNWTYLGLRSGGSQKFYGLMDEVKIWRVARTAEQIESDMHSSDGSDPGLQLYFDFNKPVGASTIRLPNLASNGIPATSLFAGASTQYVETAIRTVSVGSPYTTITFPRTYITQTGGWKVPDSITLASVLVVGGGGGGGGGYEGGGGGAGGFIETTTALTSGSTYQVKVGTGGRGAGYLLTPTNGQSSSAFGRDSLGGGYGAYEFFSTQGAATSGGSGGGGGWGNSFTAGSGTSGQGNSGGASALFDSSAGCSPTVFVGGGGGGAGTAAVGPGLAGGAQCTKGGNGGDGKLSAVTGTILAAGGGGSIRIFNTTGNLTSSYQGLGGSRTSGVSIGGDSSYYDNVAVGGTGAATNGKYGTGSGGGAGYASNPTISPNGPGGWGGTGVVALRYITASRPTYTKPTNAFLNVGMTETFTTNVAQDSATAVLTRTFKWESTTAGSGGTFTTIKQGTGANNAFFSWVPTDTATTGSNYLYRLTVTDSDTAGLFITDSSTAFAVINGALSMTGINTIKKTINVARSDTYTVFAGTSTYRYSLSPIIPGITLDSTTAMSPVLRISDTATVGTYLETITVTDSVSATFSIPLTITISAPPSLTAGGEVVKNGQVLNLDAGNRASLIAVDGAATTNITWNDLSGGKKNGSTSNTVNSTVCNAPTYSTDFGGILDFTAAGSTCYNTPYLGSQFTTGSTIEAWFKTGTATFPNQFQVISQQYNTANEQISLVIGDLDRVNGNIYVGFYDGAWRFPPVGFVPVQNQWNHVVGTYNGETLTTYLNGVSLGILAYKTPGGLVNTKPLLIGKRWDSTYHFTGSIGEVRAYTRGLSAAEVLQNYNATKYRYESSNQTILKPTQKYGALNIETFTVTSGGDTKTVTFATGNRTGITWDTTSTPGQIKLSVQESITPGTYSDTITVTDNFGSATTLPIRFTVTKADTITVTAGAATTQVFNNQQATSLPAFGISGLVSSDTATFTQKYTGIDWTKPCSQGGGCEVGDTGPGGGTIFYISPTAINSASGISTGGRYLEVAPINWSGLSVESTTAWARAATSVTGTLSAIGAGAENTRLINSVLTTNSVAAKVAADLNFGGKTDWFLPSTLELKEMYDALYAPSLAGNLSIRNYWSSTQDPTLNSRADTYWFGSGGLVSPTDKLGSAITLRPIRAYSPDTITVTTVPTFVDSYTVSVDTITMTSGLLSNYQAVQFQRSGLDITQARQDSLRVNTYGATLGLPFTVTILGGSGSGARTQTLVAGSTATGCAISGDTMTSTSAGACNLQIKKAYSRNYLTESTTATVFFLLWVINQPAPAVGSGPNIALNGENVVTTDAEQAPTFSSLSVSSGAVGSSLTINGSGFFYADPTKVEIKFSRSAIATTYTLVSNSVIQVTVPVGASTSRIVITTPRGFAATSTFTVVP